MTENINKEAQSTKKPNAKELLEQNQALQEELAKAQVEKANAEAEAISFKDNWYRTAAEFENFKKRNVDTRKNAYFDGKKDCILNLLTIGDSIDRALTLEMDEKTRTGVELISRQFYDSLKAMGVEAINPVGEPFTPETSEAIATMPCGEGDTPDTIKTVYKKGYTLDGKIIRYCQVVITK
ncbi:MAG: nucleotide exchange factor GrpE [Clostridia bacterium]|nr:nucleotide exchange factor GrpE [Clostridia bacterium]